MSVTDLNVGAVLESDGGATSSPVMITETTTIDTCRIAETTTAGRLLLRIIDVGEGTSGDYPAETLRQAATDRVFPAGTHCYIDHAATLRRGPGGERSVTDLAAVLAEDARWDHASQSLVAEATILPHTVLSDPATMRAIMPHIGMSISASAILEAPAAGHTKPLVRRLVTAESVDFVVHAGRGGKILGLLESAHPVTEAPSDDRRDQLRRAARDTYSDPATDTWVGVADFDDAARIVWLHIDDTLWQQTYDVAADDRSVTLTGPRTEVRAVTTYVPASSVGVTETDNLEGKHMSDITQAELDTKQAQLDAATARAETAEAALAEAATKQKITDNRVETARRVDAATEKEHPAIAARVQTVMAATVGESLPTDLDAQISSAVEAEKAYAARLTESQLTGFGPSTTTSVQPPARTRNAFGRQI